MAAPNVGALEFLKAIWGDTEGWAEVTVILKSGGVRSHAFAVPQEITTIAERVPSYNKDGNVYMGVCLKKERWPRDSGRLDSQKKPIMELRGTEANALGSWVVWMEADFSGEVHKRQGETVPEDRIRKALKEFPFKPSIILKSGGGIHVYWLLKEAAIGDELKRVKAVNRALAHHFSADHKSVDLARILRVPGSFNLKYSPPRQCEISWWKPDFRYNLWDFEDILPKDLPKVTKVTEVTHSQVTGAQAVEPDENGDRTTPTLLLPEDAVAEVAVALGEAWPAGFKHESALHVAGLFAWWGVVEESAKAVVQAVSDATGGDTLGRLKDVESTYRSFLEGRPVTGKTSFVQMIETPGYPLKSQAEHFLKTITRVCLRVRGSREPGNQKSPEDAAGPDIESLPVNQSLKEIIRGGLPAYVLFKKSTETSSKFSELQADGKMSRTVADCFLITSLLRESIEEPTIIDIFRDPKNKISEKALEKPAYFQKYMDLVMGSCRKTLKNQPKWKTPSIAHAASGLVDKEFEDQHFTVKKVTKYKQDQPTFDIVVSIEGLESTVRKCSVDQAYDFDTFAKTYFTQFDRFLPFQKQATWEKMYEGAEHETIEIHEGEGTLIGQIEETLDDLAAAAVGEKNGKIGISHNAVRMDDGDIVFKTRIVMRMLKDRGVDIKKQDVTHTLTALGCPYGTRRLAGHPTKVWTRASSNGRGDADEPAELPPAPMAPKPPADAPSNGNGHSSEVSEAPSRGTLFDVEVAG